VKEKTTKKSVKEGAGMRGEYDFSGGVHGKYAERFAAGTNLVALDQDVAEFFPDSASVNRTLRPIADLLRKRSRAKTLTATAPEPRR